MFVSDLFPQDNLLIAEASSPSRDDDFIGHELAKHDINATFKHYPHKTRVYVDQEDQQTARKIIQGLGYGNDYEVASEIGSFPSIKKEAFGQTEMDGTPVQEAFADQGAGHSPEESVAKKHRVSVTVVEPYIQNKDTSESQIEKFVRVTAKDRIEAENRAKQYYKKKGFKVIDAHYVSPVFEQAMTEDKKGFMVAYNDQEAKDHFLDYLFDHTGDGHAVNDTRNNFVRYSYPMKNRNAAIAMAVKANIEQSDAEDAYNAIAFEYDGKWE